jgi:hypothetical protein
MYHVPWIVLFFSQKMAPWRPNFPKSFGLHFINHVENFTTGITFGSTHLLIVAIMWIKWPWLINDQGFMIKCCHFEKVHYQPNWFIFQRIPLTSAHFHPFFREEQKKKKI